MDSSMEEDWRNIEPTVPEISLSFLAAQQVPEGQMPSTSGGVEAPEEDKWREGAVAKNAKFYSSMHKIDFAAWNPRHTVCALASDKGEVSVRRVLGKQGWRAELSGETGLMWADDADLRAKTKTLLAICWSPDGEVLACSMNSGLVHYLDVESGRIKFTLRVSKPFTMLKWFRIEDVRNVYFADYDHMALCKTPNFAIKADAQLTRDEMKELEDLEDFVADTLPRELVPTILVGACSGELGATVEVFAGGVIPITRIEPNIEKFPNKQKLDPMSFEVKALHLDHETKNPRRLWVSYSVIGQAVPSHQLEADPSYSQEGYGYHTFMAGYDLRLTDPVYLENIMALATRYGRLLHAVVLLREIFTYMVKDWKVQSNIFQARLKEGVNSAQGGVKGPVIDYCSSLLDVILTGQMSGTVFNCMHDGAKEVKIAEMHKFLDERFSELIKLLAGPMTVAGNIIHYQTLQLIEEFIAFKEADNILNVFEPSGNLSSYPSKKPQLGDEDFSKRRELQFAKETAILLGQRIFETKIVSFANRKDLKALVKFLAISPPFTHHLKGPKKEETIRANDTFDTRTLVNYIIATFGEYVDLDNEAIKSSFDEPLEQVLTKFRCLAADSKENCQLHDSSIQAESHEPRLDRVNDYFGDSFQPDLLPKELELSAEWPPMWTEHHRIDPEKYDKLKDSHRTLKQSVDTIRNSFVELTEFLAKELHFDDHTVEVIAVEFSHPEGFEKVVLTSWEDVAQQDPIASQPCESKIGRHIPVETEKGAFLQKIIDHSKELPRLVFIGKRSTKGAEDGVVRTFAFAKDGLKVPMTLIGKTPPAEKEGLSIGVNPWDSEMRKIILDFEYYKYGTVFGVVLFPDGNEQCYLFKSTVFSHRGFVDTEATKNRRIDKVALSPEHNVGITIVPPFSKNTTGAKFGVFETM